MSGIKLKLYPWNGGTQMLWRHKLIDNPNTWKENHLGLGRDKGGGHINNLCLSELTSEPSSLRNTTFMQLSQTVANTLNLTDY